MQKSIRLLKIWKLCREKRMMTPARLAEMCGVDERTIYRDIQALCDMGVTLAGNGGYHVIAEKDGRFPPDEMNAENGALILAKTIQGEILWLRWILGFGGEAEILEPAAMREKAVKMLREGLERYGA